MANEEMSDLIRNYLNLDPSMKPKGVIKAAIDQLEPEEQVQLAGLKSMKDKLNFIAKCLDIL